MPTSKSTFFFTLLAALAACWPLASRGADDDAGALSLGGDTVLDTAALAAPATSPWRIELEFAAVHLDQRLGSADKDGYRMGVDLRYTRALNDVWRFTLSDRFDQIHPTTPGVRSARNSLREAYLGWQSPSGDEKIEFGRINVRHGQALGFNPSDFFRSGANQVITTADPLALRANRLGTWMLRASSTWEGASIALAWAPKLTHGNSVDRPFDLDLAATNARDRVLLTAGAAMSSRANVQLLGWSQAGLGAGIGSNFSWLAGDSAVIYGEWSYSNSADRPDAWLPRARQARTRFHQAAVGTTYTVSGALSVTLEADYNQSGLRRSDWPALLGQDPSVAQNVVSRGLASQELMSRRAVLLHAAYKSLAVKQLDLSGYIRRNVDDRSTVAWFELRYHWPRVDGAFQWLAATGPRLSEHGAAPVRHMLQLVCTTYF